tara:strand:- start:12 stop:239 length:228 start_codon:yes stop_codon:yes gene_type:complete
MNRIKIEDLKNNKEYFINLIINLLDEKISKIMNRKYNIPVIKYQRKSFSKTLILLYKTSALILFSEGTILLEYFS